MTSPRTPRSPGLPNPATTARKDATGALEPGPSVRPKDDAEGVLSVLPFTVLTEQEARTPATAWAGEGLHVKMPFRRTPTARSTCRCGRDRTARGTRQVRALIADHAHHHTVCPLHHTPERRTAMNSPHPATPTRSTIPAADAKQLVADDRALPGVST